MKRNQCLSCSPLSPKDLPPPVTLESLTSRLLEMEKALRSEQERRTQPVGEDDTMDVEMDMDEDEEEETPAPKPAEAIQAATDEKIVIR